MSPLPTHMADRWRRRPEPGPGQGVVYWHVLFGDNPGMRRQAEYAQGKLSNFDGLHMTPLQWLHMTTLVVGPLEQLPPNALDRLEDEAKKRLAEIRPVTVTFGRVLYHPEAVMVGTRPDGVLNPIFDQLKKATRTVTGRAGLREPETWTPHITLCYSTADQPAKPLIDALGRELPPCDIAVNSVSLVVQEGAERLWDWRPVAQIPLGGATPAHSARHRPMLA